MDWQVVDEETGQLRRKFSNESMRTLKQYIDQNELKRDGESTAETLDRENIVIDGLVLRTEDEIAADRELFRRTLK